MCVCVVVIITHTHTHRNIILERLLCHLLTLARRSGWFLDVCPGYHTNRIVAEGGRS